MTWWMWYILGILVTYGIFQMYDVIAYLKIVRRLNPGERFYEDDRDRQLTKLKDGVPDNWGLALIWPLSLLGICTYFFLEFCAWLVSKIANKLEK